MGDSSRSALGPLHGIGLAIDDGRQQAEQNMGAALVRRVAAGRRVANVIEYDDGREAHRNEPFRDRTKPAETARGPSAMVIIGMLRYRTPSRMTSRLEASISLTSACVGTRSPVASVTDAFLLRSGRADRSRRRHKAFVSGRRTARPASQAKAVSMWGLRGHWMGSWR